MKKSGKTCFTVITFFFLLYTLFPVFSAEPTEWKALIKKKYPQAVFRIDNSFEIGNKTYLPLFPSNNKVNKKALIIEGIVPDKSEKSFPKLIKLSNELIFVKLISLKDGTNTILELNEVKPELKNLFLNSKFPSDLVLPKGFFLKQEIEKLGSNLPLKLKDTNNQTVIPANLNLSGHLYLTSPDTGKIIYFDLMDFSMIASIQTSGTPWSIGYDNSSKSLFITDFAKDLIYKLDLKENKLEKKITLEAMANPVDIEVSDDGSLVCVLKGLSKEFAVFKTDEGKEIIKTKLPGNPTSFYFAKEMNLISVYSPDSKSVSLLNSNTFSLQDVIMLDVSAEKGIAGPQDKMLFLTSRNSNKVLVFDLATKKIKTTIDVGEAPNALVLHPNKKTLYVSNAKSNTISIIDTEQFTVTDTINLPIETQFPGDIILTEDGNFLIVSSETTNTISFIDTNLKETIVKLDVGATTHRLYLIRTNEQKDSI